jgi:hypothetical protein
MSNQLNSNNQQWRERKTSVPKKMHMVIFAKTTIAEDGQPAEEWFLGWWTGLQWWDYTRARVAAGNAEDVRWCYVPGQNPEHSEAPACMECGGNHPLTGSRTDCIRHWKGRAVEAENTVLVQKIYGGKWGAELRQWLDGQTITSENIGQIRARCSMPWDSSWNALVRDETASRENKSDAVHPTAS